MTTTNKEGRQQFPLRSLIKATGGRPFFVRRTKLSREQAKRYLEQSKSLKAPALLEQMQASAAG